ncbi:hypothetical protein AJ78_04397 [Emergomyces pasteurianus Ep9510]|uniref:Uncharacterized protein n=1 Tax=Emergomyces pasteurianus Ep9510 TaxID=1447872 RepID=A0A1J9PG10_9EURO|nr:hypothetical protein AJ78_04397 [Emergomyces pasteurianus Ep9510]
MNLSADDIGPNVEFNNERRYSLLCQLEDTLDEPLSAIAWSCLWLADMSRLEFALQYIQTSHEERISTTPREVNSINICGFCSTAITTSERTKSGQRSTRFTITTATTGSRDTPPRGLKRKRHSSPSTPEIQRMFIVAKGTVLGA